MAVEHLFVLNLSGYIYTEADGVACYINEFLCCSTLCYGHFLPLQCPIHFLSRLDSRTLCQLWSQSGQLLWASLVCSSQASRDPPAASNCAAHSSHGTCLRRAHSVEKQAQFLCRATIYPATPQKWISSLRAS